MPAKGGFFLIAICEGIFISTGKDGKKTGIVRASMNYAPEILLVVRFKSKLLPQYALGLHKGDTWDSTMLIQADMELPHRRIESLDNLNEISILLASLKAPKDKY